MSNTFNNLVKIINDKKSKIQDLENSIQTEKVAYEKRIAPYESKINTFSTSLALIYGRKINVSLGDLQTELSRICSKEMSCKISTNVTMSGVKNVKYIMDNIDSLDQRPTMTIEFMPRLQPNKNDTEEPICRLDVSLPNYDTIMNYGYVSYEGVTPDVTERSRLQVYPAKDLTFGISMKQICSDDNLFNAIKNIESEKSAEEVVM